MNQFSKEVAKQLGYYVYLLIDPDSGQPFYVGKGKENRLFAHVQAGKERDVGEEFGEDDKLDTIRAIVKRGKEVKHIVHRHGMSEKCAFEVEAALIDHIKIENLTNKMKGTGADRGPGNAEFLEIRHSKAPMRLYPKHRLLFIRIKDATVAEKGDVYEAVRAAWKINRKRAKGRIVLAIIRQICVGIFEAETWKESEEPGRSEFEGRPIVDQGILDRYLKKRLPDDFWPRGARNPFKYYP